MSGQNPYISPGSQVAVLGYGTTGRAAVDYALFCGAQVRVSDARDSGSFAGCAAELERRGVVWEAGGHSEDFFAGVDLVLISPGISPSHPIVKYLRSQHIPLYGELAIAAPLFAEQGATVIAVTGSNGKTTVTSLIGEVLQQAGKGVFVGGNIGVSLYGYCRRTKEEREEFVVVEVSSFQLEYGGSFAPDIAVLLNISPDHLDWHGDMENYAAAKMAIFSHQKPGQVAITQRQYVDFPAEFAGEKLFFGWQDDDDARIRDGQLVLREKGEKIVIALPENAVGFAAENFAAAALALRAAGVLPQQIEEGFARFTRPPHRLEEVAEIAGVLYINDSKATNTGAVLGALQQQSRPVILIAGGRGKGEDYSQLLPQVKEKVRDLIVIGEAAEEIAAALAGSTKIHAASSLEQAVLLGSELASSGDVVLLSPACASFDMFSSYGERGECFCKAVAKLRGEKG